MDDRYSLLSSVGVRNISEYNSIRIVEKMPYIVVVIDEYADLIMTSGRQLEQTICRLAQKARAVGIHVVLCTQRPDTKVVTGNIKANFPTRIAFRTTTGIDSRVILDQLGAERLNGRGDMLYFSGVSTVRVQCALATIDDVTQTCQNIQENYSEYKSEFRLPLSAAELAQKQREEYLEQYYAEQKRKEQNRREAEQRTQEWLKEREKNKEAIEAHKNQLFRQFYGSNDSYMTLFIPGRSKLKK